MSFTSDGTEFQVEVVVQQILVKMRFQCLYIVVMETLGGVGLDLLVHHLDHAIRPRMLDQCGAMFDLFLSAHRREGVFLVLGLLAVRQGVIAEFDAVVGEDFLDFERVLRHGVFEEGGGSFHAFVVPSGA